MFPSLSLWERFGAGGFEVLLGTKVRFVRELWARPDQGEYTLWGETYDFIAVLLVEWAEAQKSVDSDRAMKWMSVSEMKKANWAETEKDLRLVVKSVVLDTMKEITGEMNIRIPSWRRMGWFKRMIKWVKDVANCDIDGQELYRTFKKIQDCQRSVVWCCWLDLSKSKHWWESNPRMLDGKEPVIIKATIPLFNEAQQTAAIGRVLAKLKIVPDVVAVNEEDYIFLQRDSGSLEIEDDEVRPGVLIETITKMQQVSRNHLDELKEVGLRVRDSEWLYSNIHEVLYHEGLEMAVDGNEQYTKILKDLRRREEEVRKVCKEISSYGIPNTLVHGDAAEHNMGSIEILEGSGYQLFDWEFAHIGHPLTDMSTIMDVILRMKAGSYREWEQECWKHWKSFVNLEGFRRLLSLVDVIQHASYLYMYETEFEVQDVKWDGLIWHLRHYAGSLQCDLDSIKSDRASRTQ
ncbi:Aminoglycoside phosphotransferase [Gracilaria domingensis]|nr:Aminoglycoside phosphotransferase [Gracilaria domingensis]